MPKIAIFKVLDSYNLDLKLCYRVRIDIYNNQGDRKRLSVPNAKNVGAGERRPIITIIIFICIITYKRLGAYT
jgi:hypothetical protein